jgi:AcrR family transcriptional regulator
MKKSAGEKTREKILDSGIKLWPHITYQSVASLTGLTHPAILYHFPKGTLKDAIAEYAVKTGFSKIIVQLMANNHASIQNLSPSERLKHFNRMNSQS